MRVWLDDEREAPAGWVRVRWPDEAIELLKTKGVKEISLDHDLGNDDRGTGYGVILWMEEAVATKNFRPPKIHVHSANPAARKKMELGVASIYRIYGHLHQNKLWVLASKLLRIRAQSKG